MLSILKNIRNFAKRVRRGSASNDLYLFCLYDSAFNLYFNPSAFHSIHHAKTFYSANCKDIDFSNCRLVLQGSFNVGTGCISLNESLVYFDFVTTEAVS